MRYTYIPTQPAVVNSLIDIARSVLTIKDSLVNIKKLPDIIPQQISIK